MHVGEDGRHNGWRFGAMKRLVHFLHENITDYRLLPCLLWLVHGIACGKTYA
jgi:hypothetical protein